MSELWYYRQAASTARYGQLQPVTASDSHKQLDTARYSLAQPGKTRLCKIQPGIAWCSLAHGVEIWGSNLWGDIIHNMYFLYVRMAFALMVQRHEKHMLNYPPIWFIPSIIVFSSFHLVNPFHVAIWTIMIQWSRWCISIFDGLVSSLPPPQEGALEQRLSLSSWGVDSDSRT